MQAKEKLYGGLAPENQVLQRQLRESGMETIAFSNFAWWHCATWSGMDGVSFSQSAIGK